MDDKRKHLEFIQATITRLANNSFTYKGWVVTLLAAIFALVGQGVGTEKAGPNTILVALVPVLVFWVLDAACLRRERMFRHLYDAVRVSETTDYSMSAGQYSMVTGTVWKTAASVEIAGLYGTLVLLTLALRILRTFGFL